MLFQVKDNSLWLQTTLSVNASVVRVFRKSLKSRNWVKSYLFNHYYVSMPSYSETKFVAHLSKSFNAYFRDFVGITAFLNLDLSWTRKTGRRNLGLKNLARSGGHQLSSRIIDDTISQFLTPLSTYAQSDLNPTYKIPRMIEKLNEKIDFVINELEQANNNNNYNCIIPPNIKKFYQKTNEITIIQDTFLSVTPNLNQYKRCWKRFEAKNESDRMSTLKQELQSQELNTTITYTVNNTKFCKVCKLGTYVQDGDDDLLWILCKQCKYWFHRNNDLKCYTDDKSVKYWNNRTWICNDCKNNESSNIVDPKNLSLYVLSDDEEETDENERAIVSNDESNEVNDNSNSVIQGLHEYKENVYDSEVSNDTDTETDDSSQSSDSSESSEYSSDEAGDSSDDVNSLSDSDESDIASDNDDSVIDDDSNNDNSNNDNEMEAKLDKKWPKLSSFNRKD